MLVRPLGIALLAIAALLSGSGCSADRTQEIPSWVLQINDGGPEIPLTLPVHLDARLPHEASTYTLRATTPLPPDLRGKDLVLAIPQLSAKTSLVLGGRVVRPIEEEASYAWHGRAQHAWRIPHFLTESPSLDLELEVDHRWTPSAWLDSVPRLSATERGDASFRRLCAINDIGALAALVSLLPFGFTHLVLFLLDRRRPQNGWFVLQALTAAVYPAFGLGYSQYLFGAYEGAMLGVTQAIAPVAGFCFTRAAFKLGPPPRIYALLIACVCVLALVGPGPFTATRYLALPVVGIGMLSVGHHLYTLVGLARRRPRPQNTLVLLSLWIFVIVSIALDGPTFLGVGEPFGGLRTASWGLALVGLLQTVALSRDYILSLKGADQLNIELAERVLLLETHQNEIQVLNDELRRQVADRSRNLEAAFSRIASGLDWSTKLAAGDVIEERYRVVRIVGVGGMGCVYEVARVSDGRRLALKVLTKVTGSSEVARFAREAQIASSVDHPNVVAIVDVDIAASGYVFLVMEYVHGASLAEKRERYGDLPWALGALRQIAEGLAAIHAKGIVHRDLKPGNVLLTDETFDGIPRAKISDFGVSSLDTTDGPRESDIATMRLLARDETGASPVSAATPLTMTGVVMGTPIYMAPELAHGAKSALPGSDLFSLGVIAFEILTGRRPYSEPLALAVLKGNDLPDPPPPLASLLPHLDPMVADLVDRALRIAPETRGTAREFADALARGTKLRA